MIRYLIKRPIAVISSFLILIFWGAYCFSLIPVSLLPSVSIPEAIVKYNYDNSAEYIEKEITEVLRASFSNLDDLVEVNGISSNQTGRLKLSFENGTKMDHKFIEINEILDRNISRLPSDLERPQITLLSTSDIPVIRIQLTPYNNNIASISEFVEKTIKKRFEQIKGVSIVDINGLRKEKISITPNINKLILLGLTESSISEAIKLSNIDIGSLNIRDGNYEYFLKVTNKKAPLDSIKILTPNGPSYFLRDLAEINIIPSQSHGSHLFNSNHAIVLTIQKLSSAKMTELMKDVNRTVSELKKDYPQIKFEKTQDQTFLLDAGIDNLYADLLYGSVICFVLIILILGNYASTIVIFISIPLAFLITFLFFYLFDISFNIISLSGLALGVGMLIDNSIVVIDNITRNRKEGKSIDDSCVIGIKQIYATVISQVLTTVAIYIPLIYLDGTAGELVYDQALALTISLFTSVLISFFLNPVLYKLLLKSSPESLQKETFIYLFISKLYHRMIEWVLENKKTASSIILFCSLSVLVLFQKLELSYLPEITQNESTIKINWNEPISLQESESRVNYIMSNLDVLSWEADLGITQFLLKADIDDIQNTEIYYACNSEKTKKQIDERLNKIIKNKFPNSIFSINSATNAFTQLFATDEPYAEIRIREDNPRFASEVKNIYYELQSASESNEIFEITINQNKLHQHGIQQSEIINTLKSHFSSQTVSEFLNNDIKGKLTLDNNSTDLNTILNSPILNTNGKYFLLKHFISVSSQQKPRKIYSDKNGIYHSYYLNDKVNGSDFVKSILELSKVHKATYEIKGEITKIGDTNKKMFTIFVISFLLLYFILLIEFQNFLIPFIILSTIPLGIFGAFVLLLITGNSLNIMSAMGFIVVLGIIVDDPILKVENIIRLRNELPNIDSKTLIHKAGEISLKPLLLTSLTTSLALLPMLFAPGIGNELQRPMIIVIIGGLTIGTFLALWVIPMIFSGILKHFK